jgi:hypothetical protein
MSTDDEPFDPLLEDLRALFAKDDPVPALVLETAKASLGWRRLDADLAEFLSDSALVESGEVALARGEQTRSVTLAAGRFMIDLEIDVEGEERRMLGQLSPAAPVTIELQVPDSDADPVALTIDDLGRFRTTLPSAPAIRLRIGVRSPTDPNQLSFTETSWIPL